MVEFNKILNEDQLRILELENELGEKDMEIEELKRTVANLETAIKSHYNGSSSK